MEVETDESKKAVTCHSANNEPNMIYLEKIKLYWFFFSKKRIFYVTFCSFTSIIVLIKGMCIIKFIIKSI